MMNMMLYHTSSYLALLMAYADKMNYPLLDSIYDFDYHCEHQAYVQKMSFIMKNIANFYSSIYSNIDYMSHDSIKKKVLEFLYSIGQNGKENGLITDISEINNMIIKRFMRNARFHANTKVLEIHDLGNETIIYHEVLYNSLLNDISEKTIQYNHCDERYNFYSQEIDGRFRLRISSNDNETKCKLSWKRRLKNTIETDVNKEEEREVRIDATDIDNFLFIISNVMHFTTVESYERYRIVFDNEDVEISVDEYPFGVCIEIENKSFEKNPEDVVKEWVNRIG